MVCRSSNWYNYKVAWYNFIFIRTNTHTWFIKYSKEMKNINSRWFYEWWTQFGGNKRVLSTQYQTHYEKFQVKRNISTL